MRPVLAVAVVLAALALYFACAGMLSAQLRAPASTPVASAR